MHSSTLPTALVSLLSASLAIAAPASQQERTNTLQARSAELDDCLKKANSPFASAGVNSEDYNASIAPFNKRLPWKPAAVVTPKTPEDISAAVTCGSQTKTPISAKGGGHAYNQAGLGGEDGSLVIDMKNFNKIELDDKGVASVGGGAKLGDVGNTLWQEGKKGLAHGVCPFVGVGGHAGHGGFGYASRMWGLLVDQLVSLDVTLSNGTQTTLTPDSDDLFFAFAGAASSFGIVHDFKFQSHDAPQNAVQFKYVWENMSEEEGTQLLLNFQDFVSDEQDPIPPELGVSFNPSAGVGATVYGAYYGEGGEEEFDRIFGKFLNAEGTPPNPKTANKTNLDWFESLSAFAGDQPLDTSGQKDYTDTFYATSLLTPEDKLLTKEAVGNFISYLNTKGAGDTTDTAWFVEINTYGGAKSAIANPDLLKTNSFGYRSHLLNFQLYASSKSYGPPYPEDGISFVQGMRTAITDKMPQDTDFGYYANYQDSELKDYGKGYWAEQYERLQRIKKEVDPENVFRGPQTVQPGN